MQLSFQYAMLKAAVTATGANGVCTRQAAKFIDQALIEGIDSPVQRFHEVLRGGNGIDQSWEHDFSSGNEQDIPTYAARSFAYVESEVPPIARKYGALSRRTSTDYLATMLGWLDRLFELFSEVSPRFYYVEKVRNGKKVTELNMTFDEYEAAFGKTDKEVLDRCNKAFDSIFASYWRQSTRVIFQKAGARVTVSVSASSPLNEYFSKLQ